MQGRIWVTASIHLRRRRRCQLCVVGTLARLLCQSGDMRIQLLALTISAASLSGCSDSERAELEAHCTAIVDRISESLRTGQAQDATRLFDQFDEECAAKGVAFEDVD